MEGGFELWDLAPKKLRTPWPTEPQVFHGAIQLYQQLNTVDYQGSLASTVTGLATPVAKSKQNGRRVIYTRRDFFFFFGHAVFYPGLISRSIHKVP